MKIVFCLIILSMLAGCATGNTRVTVKNCLSLGGDLWSCEQLPLRYEVPAEHNFR